MAQEALLKSWNDTPTRQVIVDFVDSVTREDRPTLIPPDERIAVFDNDGTLWPEHPMPVQLDFTLRRFAEQAAADPKLQSEYPWKAAHEEDFAWFGAAMTKHYHGDDADLG